MNGMLPDQGYNYFFFNFVVIRVESYKMLIWANDFVHLYISNKHYIY